MTAAHPAVSPLANLVDDEDEFGIAPPLPPWAIPARLVGVLHGGLRAAIRGDVALLERLPVAAWVLPVVAIAVPAVFSLLHLVIPHADPRNTNSPFILAWADVYTESLLYMVGALAIGLLAPSLGVLFVLSHTVFDLVAAALSPAELDPLLPGIAARLIAAWLLWLLVVDIPVLTRSLTAGMVDRRALGPPMARRAITVAAAAVTVLALVWIWSLAMAWLIRPVFTWTRLGLPGYQSIAPVQELGLAIAIGGAVAAAAVTAARLRLTPHAGRPLFGSSRRRGPLGLVLGHLATSILALAALGGLITVQIDLVLLFVALVVVRPIVALLFWRTPAGSLLARIPWLVRFVAAFALTMLVGLVIMPPLYDDYYFGSEFLPLILTIAIGLVIFDVLTADEWARGGVPRAASDAAVSAAGGHVTSLLFMLLAGGAIYLAAPSVASADNCAGRLDCTLSMYGAAGGAAGAAAGAGLRRRSNGPPPPPPDKDILTKAGNAIGLISKAPGQSHLKGPMSGAKALTGWQLDMGGEISRQMGGDPPRDDFREIAVAEEPMVPELPDEGLPPRTAAALRELHRALAEYIVNGRAAVLSYDRYGGARRARDRDWAREQAVAVIRFKREAGAAALATADRIDAYLAAARDEAISDEVTTADEVRAYQQRLRSEGFPPAELAAARALGLTEEEIEATRQRRLAADPEKEAGSSLAYFTELAATFRDLGETLSNLPAIPPERKAA